MKLWDKGYDIDSFTEKFTVGKDRELDVMLAKADVLGNMAHLKMLYSIGLVNDSELTDLERALKEIGQEIDRGEFRIVFINSKMWGSREEDSYRSFPQ